MNGFTNVARLASMSAASATMALMHQPGRNKVAVLAYELWQQRFGGDRRVIGRKITLDGVPTEIVGVMPKDFSFPAARVIWLPLEYSEDFTTTQRGAWYLNAIGRVKPGVPIEQVTAEVQTIGKQLAKQYRDSNEGLDFTAMPLHEAMVGDIRKAVLVLLGAVGFVLLIACTNVANLLLARAAARNVRASAAKAPPGGSLRARALTRLRRLQALLGFGDLLWLEPIICVELNTRFDPELRFTVSMLDMHVCTRFFSREEVKGEASNTEDCRAHTYRIPESLGGETCRPPRRTSDRWRRKMKVA